MPSASECYRSVNYHGSAAVAAIRHALNATTASDFKQWQAEAIFHAGNAGHYGKIIVCGFKPVVIAIAESEAELQRSKRQHFRLAA